MSKELIIKNDLSETVVALLEDQILTEIHFEKNSCQRLAGNIYKGFVDNILPGMQAAFVDIGLEKNGFLYVDEAVPQKMDKDVAEPPVNVSINDILKKGQELLVQIVKEPVGSKGARVTTQPTLPGRYTVLMPTINYIGISRRIENEKERQRLKDIATEISNGNVGVIVRTVAEGASKEELAYDIKRLTRQWKRIQATAAKSKAPSIVHKDLSLLKRVMRDMISDDIGRIIVNNQETYDTVLDIMSDHSSHLRGRVIQQLGIDLFGYYSIDNQIEKALRRKVWLKCGGYIIFDEVEALTVIDVNTGKFIGKDNLAATVLQTNMEAAVEIARQLRLRNIGGIIIIDFIDMETTQDKEKVWAIFEETLKKDRIKTHILGVTQLGLLEMTRKKNGQKLSDIMQKECPFCEGKGRVYLEEVSAARIQKEIEDLVKQIAAKNIYVQANPVVAGYIIGTSGNNLANLENKYGCRIMVKGSAEMRVEEYIVRPSYEGEEETLVKAPVKTGEKIKLRVLEPHTDSDKDGIARQEGFIICIENGGQYVGQDVWVEIGKVCRTYAQAFVVEGEI